MAPSRLALLPALVCCAMVASTQATAITRRSPDTGHQTAVEQFTAAVNKYVELRRLPRDPLADLTHGADPEHNLRAWRARRSLIREARAIAERPRIFSPDVSVYFRERIRLSVGTVLDSLPRLPIDVAYRFDGTDLVLIDVETGLIVDVLEDALPSIGREESEPDLLDPEETCAPEPLPVIEGSPCDAHQELEMCWS